MTDIHLGEKSNSQTHNQDCLNFTKWFINQAKEKGAETCAFLGDFHHHRSTINTLTLNYSYEVLKLLNDNFEKVYFIVGNHDLFYREKRDIHSLIIANELPNFVLIDKPLDLGEVYFLPWLVENEWKNIPNIHARYLFGHFELPGFKMNALVDMPDHGMLNSSHFKNQEYVFSGHFHKRQTNGKVFYIGNPFGHNYSDAGDFERGMCFLEWGGKPEFVNWEDGPKYVSTTVSKIAEDPGSVLLKNAYVKALIDVDMSYEEVSYLKEEMIKHYPIRELKLIEEKSSAHSQDSNSGEVTFESVDSIVANELVSLESEAFDKNLLMDIYNSL